MLAAADTFRAAAADQLQLWAERTGSEIVRAQEGADPGSIVFDAMSAAAGPRCRSRPRRHRGPAAHEVEPDGGDEEAAPDRRPDRGRLQRGALGDRRVDRAERPGPSAQFAGAVDVTGIVLTKLDGTAKGGIVLAIQAELGLPGEGRRRRGRRRRPHRVRPRRVRHRAVRRRMTPGGIWLVARAAR